MNIITMEDDICDRATQLHLAGRFPEAEALYRQVLARRPNHGAALFGLGTLAHQCGQNVQAVQILNHAAQFVQTSSLYNNLGEAYRALNQGNEAESAYRKAISLNPRDGMPYNNMGIILCLQGRLRESEECWRQATALVPNYADALNNLGNAMLEQGEAVEAERYHREVLRIKPDFARAHSNLLRDLNHVEPLDPIRLRQEHAQWWKQQAACVIAKTSWNNTRDADRPLKIGLVSPDFREHSVAYFLEPWLARRDRDRIRVFCYAELMSADPMTDRLAKLGDSFRTTTGVPDETLATQLEADGIDILIDLAGHTASNRLRLFAFKPAPVQASFLGYPFTTGSPTIDWKITDAQADPPGTTEAGYTERLWRLPKTAWCYRPMENAPDVSPTPAGKNGFITFGSFNTIAKVGPRVVDAWATLLKRVPHARLLLKANALGDEGVRQRMRDRFGALGVSQDRLILMGRQTLSRDHLAAYEQIDIALDTFPYNGTTTTCEALWMGVPVVTVAGTMHIERVGVSLMTTVGLPDLIAPDVPAYIETAVRLAGDPPRLADLRRTMRDRLRRSPLTDEIAYARDFDEALRGMWAQCCNR